MTLREYIYDLKMLLRNNRLVDDDRLTDRLVKEWINTSRAEGIKKESAKPGWQVPEQLIQSLGCINLEVSDRSHCPSLLTTGGSILRTSQDIPKTVSLRNRDGIIEVGPVDKIALPFSYVPIHRARFIGNGKFNSTAISAFMFDKRIYLWANLTNASFYKYIRYIGVRAICEDPTEAARFNHVDGTPCYTDDSEYPMDVWMWNYIKNDLAEKVIKYLLEVPVDKTNNAEDATQER